MEEKKLEQIEQSNETANESLESLNFVKNSVNEMLRKKIFSFDAETNGLRGQAFAIAAVVELPDGTKKEFVGRCPIGEEVNPWVSENVLPQMKGIQETYKSYEELLAAFSKFYLDNKDQADVIVHMGVPVEAKLFIDAHNNGNIGDWDGPYPLIDISALPDIGTSVDSYNQKHGIVIPSFEGGTHNPLYDSYAALEAYKHLLASKSAK